MLYNGGNFSRLDMQDSTGETMLRINDSDDARISDLWELARRYALKVDDAIADLFKELDEPQR
jgi:hypothetical protein